MRFALLAIAALALNVVSAEEVKPIVRATLTPEIVNVGEATELTITVMVPTWFARPPVYPSFELANAITRLPADSSYPIQERIGNESWAGIVRTYEIYPLLGATYRMNGKSIAIAYANPGKDPVTADVEVPEVVFRGSVPAGAESLDPYVAGRSLQLSLDVEGDLDSLEAGDAVVLRYVAEIDGLPAIFLPPLAPELQFDGVSVYNDVPEVDDGILARRSEKLTLVFEAGGEFRIPDLELRYWNTESNTIETAVAAGLAISVAGPPLPAPVSDVSSGTRWRQFTLLIVGMIVLVLALRRWVPVAVRRYREAGERHRQSEQYAFEQLLKALNSKSPETAYRALLSWIEKLQPGVSARLFAANFGDAVLCAAVEALSAGIYSGANEAAGLARVRSNLVAARKRCLAQGLTRRAHVLPPLNP